MTANKHTPGPWGVLNEKDGEVLLAFGAGTSADLLGTGNWYALWCGIKPHDARLIAAAPELLEALILARNELAGLPHSLGYDFTHLPKIDAAIEKATGGAA